jgi:hypothetical protein
MCLEKNVCYLKSKDGLTCWGAKVEYTIVKSGVLKKHTKFIIFSLKMLKKHTDFTISM